MVEVDTSRLKYRSWMICIRHGPSERCVLTLPPLLDEELKHSVAEHDEDTEDDRQQRRIRPPECLSMEPER
jgi:hypothetical protein